MSESSSHRLSFVKELVRGTTPANPRFKHLPDTRTTLSLTKENLATERLSPSRFPAEPRTGLDGVGGDIPVDLSEKTYDELIASALQGDWTDVGTPVTFDSVDITNDSGLTGALEVGDTFVTTGSADTVEIVSIDAQREKVVVLNTTAGIAYELSADEITVIDAEDHNVTTWVHVAEDQTIAAGTSRRSFSVLREFSDMTGEKYLVLAGLEVATWNLSAPANGLTKSTFSFMGRTQTGPHDAAALATAHSGLVELPSTDNEPFDTFSGEMKIDTVATAIVTDFNVNVNNGHAPKYVVGVASSQDPSVAQSIVDGSLTVYFEDMVLYKKFINEEKIALELTLEDLQGNKLILTIPNAKISSGSQPDVTADGAITLPINFTAHEDSSIGSHIQLRRTEAA